jgi:RNA polymerase sigma-70 factor (ECF subfamily)
VATDLELYRAWAAGDRGAGARLIDCHLAAVSRFFANKTVATAEHDDLVAMTFERCAKGLGGFRGEGSFRGYVLGIARHVLGDELRRRTPDHALGSISIADLGPSPSRIAAERDEQRLLLAGLRAIPFEYQIALELHFFEELSRDEAAAVLGIPAGTVASRLRRGRELLAQAIAALAGSPALANATVTGLDAWAADLRARVV